jgi:hypothetical protein
VWELPWCRPTWKLPCRLVGGLGSRNDPRVVFCRSVSTADREARRLLYWYTYDGGSMMPCVGDTAASGVGAAMSVGWSEGGVGGWFLKVGVDKKDGV